LKSEYVAELLFYCGRELLTNVLIAFGVSYSPALLDTKTRRVGPSLGLGPENFRPDRLYLIQK
jgi:hypothetical protein